MRELKIGDRVVDWTGEAGTVLSVSGGYKLPYFNMRYDNSEKQMGWGWVEFSDPEEWEGTFRFEDTEYPEWPR